MANVPVTEEKLVTVLKEFRKDIRSDFHEALSQYHEEEVFPRLEDINNKVSKLDERIEKVEQGIKWIKRDFKDIKVEFADTVDRRQFNELKTRVLDLEDELNSIKQRMAS